ncbi:hypothetical protein Tco_0286144 [Tanacetum coccineum]
MTRSSNIKMSTPFDNPERQFRTRKNTTPLSVHNIYSFYESESSESEPESEKIGIVDIETLTLEQYLALERGNTIRKEHNPKDGKIEIKGQFLRELRDNTFVGNESEDAFEHLRKIQEVARFTKDMTRKFGLKETFERYLRESYKRQEDLDGWIKRFIQKTDQDLIRHNVAIKSLGERVTCLAHTISTNQSDRTPITHPAFDNANFVKQECTMKLEPSHDIPFTKVETFAEKVKRRIMEDNENKEKIS